MKNLILLLLFFCFLNSKAQHTFSIVAVDSLTGEIGSAGATCGDSIIWPGTPGARIISDVIPGKGAIHTQSYYLATNQINANKRMMAGDNPKQIIDWLVANDVQSDASLRQYGVVDYNGGHPRSAAFTGAACMDYKNHILGKNYAIQGNILIGQKVLDSMESRFLKTKGNLAEKLMAAMQGAKMIGADSRCTSNGTSSLSAFIRVAKQYDQPTGFYLDINVAGTAPGVEPITKLQEKFNAWKIKSEVKEPFVQPYFKIFPNPASHAITISINNLEADKLEITELTGKTLLSLNIVSTQTEIDFKNFNSGLYLLVFYKEGFKTYTTRILKP